LWSAAGPSDRTALSIGPHRTSTLPFCPEMDAELASKHHFSLFRQWAVSKKENASMIRQDNIGKDILFFLFLCVSCKLVTCVEI
jgi:hypothetical protein